MDLYQILGIISGVIFFTAFIPYMIGIVGGTTKPAKASWLVWMSLDSITLVGMFFKESINGQIVGAVLGGWFVFGLAVVYGTSGWTKLDKQCISGAVAGIALWLVFDEPNVGIVICGILLVWGSVPTFVSAAAKPENEDKLAWTMFWVSSVLTVYLIPKWTLEDATQPIAFLVVQTVVMHLLFIRPRIARR